MSDPSLPPRSPYTAAAAHAEQVQDDHSVCIYQLGVFPFSLIVFPSALPSVKLECSYLLFVISVIVWPVYQHPHFPLHGKESEMSEPPEKKKIKSYFPTVCFLGLSLFPFLG